MNKIFKKITIALLTLILGMSAFAMHSSKTEASSKTVTWTNGALSRTLTNGGEADKASIGKTSGKWYWEVTVQDSSNPTNTISLIGIAGEGTTITKLSHDVYYGPGQLVSSSDGVDSTRVPYGASFGNNDVIGVALDLDNDTIMWYKNGVPQGANNVKPSSLIGSVVSPYIYNGTSTTKTLTANFGATEFKYAIPTNYQAYQVDEVTATPTPTATPEPTPTITPEPTVTPEPSPSATPEVPSGSRAILTVTLTSGDDKEFDLPMNEVNEFLKWYDSASGSARYGINKHDSNKGPFSKRTEYVIHDKILTFEISEYNVIE
ncbi:SPRY domain-containing protein [Paenibacillus sp. FSL R7-0345]|uniref:SPRY domain-containing protein n=1 Tax=Paenibacillus sp. FSL R7-0345 TaxID=2954535 RepID=UPI003159E32E